ncbi:DJ-1/PfpI family protein [Candidatus Beckwithbacteria bacterium]|nr:DJ-1/PfpI family protein [Candidatus Beckwithbacteria bacterium]
MTNLKDKKVVFVLAPRDFRDEEYFQPKVILQSQAVQIFTVAKGNEEELTGSQGGKARTDEKLENITAANFDALVFVGGKGSRVYFKDKKIHKIINDFNDQQKVIAAICSAPAILANAGILKDKKAVCFEKEREILEVNGAKFVDEEIVVDHNIITARDFNAALNFGSKIAELLNK